MKIFFIIFMFSIFIITIVILSLVLDKILSTYYFRKEEKLHSKYPELYVILDELNAIKEESWEFSSTFIDPLIKSIDEKTEKIKYLPKLQKQEMEEEVENLKEELFKHSKIKDEYIEKEKEKYDELQSYKNFIKERK